MDEKHTPGPWDWVVHDHSMASLGVLPDPGLGNPLVMAVGPCPACADRRKMADGEWKWGCCHTPSEANARLISAAPDLLDALRDITEYSGGAPNALEDAYVMGRVEAAILKATT